MNWEEHNFKITSAHLKAAAKSSLEAYDFDNAIFLTERALAVLEDDDTRLLLATCYARNKQMREAYSILSNTSSVDCMWLKARACWDIEKYQEAEELLHLILRDDCLKESHVPRAEILWLLGEVCGRTNRAEQAAEAYSEALDLNPFLWKCSERLADLGAYEKIDMKFAGASVESLHRSTPHYKRMFNINGDVVTGLSTSLPSTGKDASPTEANAGNTAVPRTTSPVLSSGDIRIKVKNNVQQQPASGTHVSRMSRVKSQTGVLEISDMRSKYRKNRGIVRKASSNSSFTLKSKSAFSSKISSGLAVNDLDTSAVDHVEHLGDSGAGDDGELSETLQAEALVVQSLHYIMELFKKLADGYTYLSKYECKKSIAQMRSLPRVHYRTAFVQRLLGKCHYERLEYVQSANCYKLARKLSPYDHEGMDLYSTVLWQLRKSKELSCLGHQLVSEDRRSAIAWCVVGNTFSVHKEHELAQGFFERAIQLDPHYLYAYTLLGLEYEALEGFAKAKACYLKAARINPRYYNVWNALGQAYLREEIYDKAEFCFRKAQRLNSSSTVIACNIGSALLAQKRYKGALDSFHIALGIDAKNAVASYHTAKVLCILGRDKEALQLLEELMDIAPGESKIYYLISKIYRQLGQTNEAGMYASWARDLDPQRTKINNDSEEDDDESNDIVEDEGQSS
eukprot:CFRG3044T1